MKNKKIVFVGPGRVEVTEEEIDGALAPDEVLVEVVRSTISSGTERANLAGNVPTSIFSDALPTYPLQTGYSAAGRVLAVGEEVRSVAPGERVALVWSKHSRYLKMKEGLVHRIPSEEITFGEAALAHIVTFSEAAVRKCGVEMGESALVMGLGVLGMLAVELLRAAGACPIVACDPVPDKRTRALAAGADAALDPYDPDFAQKVRDLTGGGANVAIEVTGVGAALVQALDVMAPMGRLALLGCTRRSDFSVDFYHKVHGTGVTLIGANTNCRPTVDSSRGLWTSRDDIAAYFRLLLGRRIETASLIEEVHTPEESPEVYRRLLAEPSFPLVQFDWEA